MNNLLLLSLFFSFSICTASLVESINIVGNDHTQNRIILREIQHPIPGEYDSTLSLEDRNRIYNLGLFSTVEIKQIDSFYTVFLVETFQFYPIPLLDHNEAKGWSYGGGVEFLNFRGLNQKLIFGSQIGKENTYFLAFRDPWIIGDHVSLSGSVSQFSWENPFYSYKYKGRGFEIGTGFYKKKFHKFNISIGFTYSTIDTSDINVAILEKYENIPLNYKYIRGEFTYRYDTRDIYLDPTSGTLMTLFLKPKFSFGKSNNYHLFSIKYLKFFKISDGYLNPVISFNTRFLFQKSKSFPIFAYKYLGGENFVRGYSPIPEKNSSEVTNLIEGYNIFYHSVQLQHTLFEKEEYNKMKFGLELGIDMVYFVDMGIISDELSSFKLRNTIVGYGFGFRFFASGIGVIGLDFGFNPYGQMFYHLSDS